MAATRRTTRRLGNENAVQPAATKATSTKSGLAAKEPAAKARTTKASLAAKGTTGALGTKAVNKTVSAAGPLAKGDVKPNKPRTRASAAADNDVKMAESNVEDIADRPIKALKGVKRTGALGVRSANVVKAAPLVPAKKAAAGKRVKPDTKRALVDPEEETEQDDEVKAARSKRARVAKDAGWQDLDEGDEDDPMMVTEYVEEVYEYLKELELQTMPDSQYMARQTELTWRMRGILCDWLVDVHSKFRLLPETIFLATNIVDRFLSIRTVSLVKFQLVGVTALFIAAKYEEIVCPSISSFLYMTDGGYTDEEILKAERYMLQMIGYDLSYPNPINFLRRISKADQYDVNSRTVAKYFMEMACVDRRFMQYPPSILAAAACWLSRKVLDRGEWDCNLVHYSTYSEEELLPCAQQMLNFVARDINNGEPTYANFNKKYSSRKFVKSASLVEAFIAENYFEDSSKLVAATSSSQDDEASGSDGASPKMVPRLDEWSKY